MKTKQQLKMEKCWVIMNQLMHSQQFYDKEMRVGWIKESDKPIYGDFEKVRLGQQIAEIYGEGLIVRLNNLPNLKITVLNQATSEPIQGNWEREFFKFLEDELMREEQIQEMAKMMREANGGDPNIYIV